MSAGSDLAVPVDPEHDHWRGGEGALVTIVEYGDYQCPYSRLAFRAVQQLEGELGSRLCYVYRHFPHPEKDHPWALEAAAFVEAAGLQDRFWDAHEIVFHRQKALDHESLLGYAGQLGLDVDRLAADLPRDDLAQRVRADFGSARESGLTGTPGLFVNGSRYHGDSEYDQLAPVVTAAL